MGDHYNNLPILKRAVSNIKIEDIFEEGPGVYYYSSCRGSHVPFATSLKYERTKEANIVKQYINTHADANIIPNIQPKLQEISNIEANRIITILTNIAKQKGMNINDFFDDGLESFQENPSVEHINRSLLSRNELNELIRSNTYDKLEDVRKTGRLYGLMQHTRRLSVNQQSRRGGRRKRRHTRKRTSKKY
jgi:hypothetical protein